MCYDISSNRLLGICCKHCCSIHLCYHLVGDHNCHTKLQGEKQQFRIHTSSTTWMGKKKKELSAIPSAVHNHSTTHLKTKWKQTASRQKAICRRLLRCTGKPIISPLGSKAKFIIYLICKSKQHTQKSGKMHLSGWQLTSAGVIRPVKGCGTVHNQQCIPGEVKYNVLRNCSRS